MEHEEIMRGAITMAAAFIHNGDVRHDNNFRNDRSGDTQEIVTMLLVQMYRTIQDAAHETQQASWADRMIGNDPHPDGSS